MPVMGELKQKEIEHNDFHQYIWHACETCGKERWVKLVKGEPKNKRCFPCGKGHGGRKGDRDNNHGVHGITISPEERRLSQRLYQKESVYLKKMKILMRYSDDKPACRDCGESDMDTLCLDHINGGGNKHRRNIGDKGGTNLYTWIIKNNYPDGFRVLCANCNLRKTRFELWRNRSKRELA